MAHVKPPISSFLRGIPHSLRVVGNREIHAQLLPQARILKSGGPPQTADVAENQWKEVCIRLDVEDMFWQGSHEDFY